MPLLDSGIMLAVGRVVFAMTIKRRVTFEIEQRTRGVVYATRCPHCGHDGLPLRLGRRHTCPVCDTILAEDYSTEGVVYRSGALPPGSTQIDVDCASGLAVAAFLAAMQAYEGSRKAADSLARVMGSSINNK